MITEREDPRIEDLGRFLSEGRKLNDEILESRRGYDPNCNALQDILAAHAYIRAGLEYIEIAKKDLEGRL